MTLYRFRAEPLAPIHVGAGEEIDPTAFTLKDGRLLRFNAARVLADMNDAERERIEGLLSGGAGRNAAEAFGQLKDTLARNVDPARHGAGWIDVGSAFAKTWAEVGSRADQQFRVQLMPRNAHSGLVYLPGSSLKGAIRTAVVSEFSKGRSPPDKVSYTRHELSKFSQGMERELLGRFESDPFRLVDVEDAPLPDGATRIDRVFNWNPQKSASEGMQMWYERIKSRADGAAAIFDVRLHIDDKAMANERVRARLHATLDFQTIAGACNAFYWRRLLAERKEFFMRPGNGALRVETLLEPFTQVTAEGKPAASKPALPAMLLRIGRFSQFESLSADGVRVGHRPQQRNTDKEWIPDPQMGWTRNLCEVTTAAAGGPTRMPFGWLLLTHEGTTQS